MFDAVNADDVDTHEFVTCEHHLVPMRDGVRLATDVYRPSHGRDLPDESTGQRPVVLHRTPYCKARWKDTGLGTKDCMAHVACNVTCRGTWSDEGRPPLHLIPWSCIVACRRRAPALSAACSLTERSAPRSTMCRCLACGRQGGLSGRGGLSGYVGAARCDGKDTRH